jgi:hypothetical protein
MHGIAGKAGRFHERKSNEKQERAVYRALFVCS